MASMVLYSRIVLFPLLQGEIPAVNPIMFECLTAATIRKTALATQGAAGPSMHGRLVCLATDARLIQGCFR